MSIDKNDETAVIDYRGIRKSANISLIDCQIGDWVLVHVGFAIQRVDEDSAKQTYNLLDEAHHTIAKDLSESKLGGENV